jgi:ABC-type Co2+ transport system permease subunit
MHIEPGILSSSTLAVAAVAAAGLGAAHAPRLWRRVLLAPRVVLAAAFFTLCMELVHLKVGPSELHLVGAMPMYLAFGLVPALFAFALGLLVQAMLFEPADLLHLAVNTLSLAVPLLVVHALRGRHLRRVTLADVLRLDALYYGGVTLMVGFWLLQAETATPLADWARFAASYLAVVVFEPVLTVAMLGAVARLRGRRGAGLCFDARVRLAEGRG